MFGAAAGGRPLTVEALHQVTINSVVNDAHALFSSDRLAVVTSDSRVIIIDATGEVLHEQTFDEPQRFVRVTSDGCLLLGGGQDTVRMLDSDHQEGWTQNIESGCLHFDADEAGSCLVFIDGSRTVHRINASGESSIIPRKGEIVMLCVERSGKGFALANDEGHVQIFDRHGEVVWSVDTRVGGVPDRLHDMLLLEDLSLVLGLESLEPTDRPEGENVIQIIAPDASIRRTISLPTPPTVLECSGDELLVGTRGSEVHRIDLAEIDQAESDELSVPMGPINMYEIRSIARTSAAFFIGSWFYVNRRSESTSEASKDWEFEHTGYVSHIIAFAEGNVVAVVGDDQNDYTDGQTISLLDPAAEGTEPQATVPEDLMEFAAEDAAALEAKRADAGDAFAELLTEEEQMALGSGLKTSHVETEDLLSDLGDALKDLEDMDMDSEAISFDTESLIEDLSIDTQRVNLPPVCDAGDDMELEAEDDGTAIIVLDGSKSYDPDGEIEKWEWRRRDGQVIGDKAKIQVKINSGIHIFELIVTDNDGASTRDSVEVKVR